MIFVLKMLGKVFIKNSWWALAFSLLALLWQGCSTKTAEPDSLKESYFSLLRKSELQQSGSQIITDMQKLVTDFEGTRYASLAKLRLAEMMADQLTTLLNKAGDFDQIELYYRLFLIQNPNHPLTPYIYKRLLEVAYIKSVAGFFVTGVDPKPYQNMLQQAISFQLLYPNNLYKYEVQFYYAHAKNKLAEYEINVGDWYYQHKSYSAAANRYNYVLLNYPEYKDLKGLALKLIDAYQKDQASTKAGDAIRSFEQLYHYNPYKANTPGG